MATRTEIGKISVWRRASAGYKWEWGMSWPAGQREVYGHARTYSEALQHAIEARRSAAGADVRTVDD